MLGCCAAEGWAALKGGVRELDPPFRIICREAAWRDKDLFWGEK